MGKVGVPINKVLWPLVRQIEINRVRCPFVVASNGSRVKGFDESRLASSFVKTALASSRFVMTSISLSASMSQCEPQH